MKSPICCFFFICLYCSSAGAVPLVDPYISESGTRVATIYGSVSNPNIGSGTTWIYDSNLPASGITGFGRDQHGSRAWGRVDSTNGIIDSELANASGNAYVQAFVSALPTHGDLVAEGGTTARATIAVYGPSDDGLPMLQHEGSWGGIVWTLDSAGNEHWIATKYDWSPKSDSFSYALTKTTIAEGLGPLEFSLLSQHVFDILGGRDLGFYQVLTQSLVQGSHSIEDNYSYAKFGFSPVPVPAAAWLFATGILGLIGFGKRKKAA